MTTTAAINNDQQKSVRTTCPYCGVGCGIIATVDEAGLVSVKGDPDHPANYGRLCSKGAALGETVDLNGRLLYPCINGQRVDWNTALNDVSEKFKSTIDAHGPDSVAFYVSGQLLTEDYYVANKLMKGFIGSANIDTNSRLCMSSSVAGHKRAFGSDTVPCSYEDLERAKLIVLVGSNTAWCHPVLFQRIRNAAKNNSDLNIVVIDPRKTATCDIADLHLPLKPGTDVVLFNGLLTYLNENDETNHLFTSQYTQGMDQALDVAKSSSPSVAAVAAQCGLGESVVAEFYRMFSRTERVVSVYSQGVNQSSAGTDKVNSIINCHLLTGRIGRPGMGPFSFTGQPNAMGGREVGGLANQLAAHMDIDNEAHRNIVQRFWSSPVIASQQGLKAIDMFEAIHAGKIKAIWIMSTNPVVSLPDADRVKAALQKCDYVVVSECMAQTDTSVHADVLLPASAWGEKNGTVTNSERRISRQREFLPAPGEAKPDWWAVAEVARRMGYTEAFDYKTGHDIFKEHAALSGYENENTSEKRRDFNIAALANIDANSYDELVPVQWPVKKNETGEYVGTARMFLDGKYFTPNQKAHFVSTEPRLPVNEISDEYPLILNTGRCRDQWHTMTRTGKSPRLTAHDPEPFVEIYPTDALKNRLFEGELVLVESRWGKAIVRARLSKDQQAGSVFMPMHWNEQFASHGRVDALVNPVCDPVSGQPELKHTPVNIKKYKPVWHGFLLSRRELKIEGSSYWIKAVGKKFYRYELAGEQEPDGWSMWSRKILCESTNDVNWVEYLDAGARRYRGARFIGNTIESCIFIAPTHELPSRNWLAGLFEKEQLSEQERIGLLSGQPLKGQEDQGKVVCACFAVGEKTIINAIKEKNLKTVDAIGECLQAGTNCGSCIPELKILLG
jgi:assimilatory nitrate reductase catalytic subunit